MLGILYWRGTKETFCIFGTWWNNTSGWLNVVNLFSTESGEQHWRKNTLYLCNIEGYTVKRLLSTQSKSGLRFQVMASVHRQALYFQTSRNSGYETRPSCKSLQKLGHIWLFQQMPQSFKLIILQMSWHIWLFKTNATKLKTYNLANVLTFVSLSSTATKLKT